MNRSITLQAECTAITADTAALIIGCITGDGILCVPVKGTIRENDNILRINADIHCPAPVTDATAVDARSVSTDLRSKVNISALNFRTQIQAAAIRSRTVAGKFGVIYPEIFRTVGRDTAAIRPGCIAADGSADDLKHAVRMINGNPAAVPGGFVAADGDVFSDRQVPRFDPDAAAVAIIIPAGNGAGAGELQIAFGNDHAAVTRSHNHKAPRA